MVSCSGFGLPLHAQLLRLFVTRCSSYVGYSYLCNKYLALNHFYAKVRACFTAVVIFCCIIIDIFSPAHCSGATAHRLDRLSMRPQGAALPPSVSVK